MVRVIHGHSIAVYKPRNPKKKQISERLIADNRVNFACAADYAENSEMWNVVKTILEKIKADCDFQHLLTQHQMKTKVKKDEKAEKLVVESVVDLKDPIANVN